MTSARVTIGSKKKARKIRMLLARDGPYCWICESEIPLDATQNSDEQLSLDHVLPVRWGGTNHNENLRLAHRICNEKRGALEDQWAA